MGGKRERQRQQILLLFAACLILLVMTGGCRSAGGNPPSFPESGDRSGGKSTTSGAPEKSFSPATEPSRTTGRIPPSLAPTALTPLEQVESQWLDRAAIYMKRGDTTNALASIDKAAACCNGRFADRTVRMLRDVLARPGVAAEHRSQAIQCFLRLEATRPDVVYGPAARCWTSALSEVLTRETDVRKLRKTIQLQKRKIQELEKQIEQLKAVDLELETPKPNLNVP
jgi:hypothetical protein